VDQKKREGWIARIGQICIFVAAIDSCGAEAAFVGCEGKGWGEKRDFTSINI